MRAAIIYTASRIGLFLGIAVVLALFGLSGYPLVLVALGLTAPASYFLLARQRVGMAVALERVVKRQQQRIAQSAAAEDEDSAATPPPMTTPRRRITPVR